MATRNHHIPLPPTIGKGETNIEALKPFIAEFNKVVQWLDQIRSMSPILTLPIEPELMRLTKKFGISCEDESSTSDPDIPKANIQYWDGSAFVDTTKPVTKSNLRNPFGEIPYDEDDAGLFAYHRQSGQFCPTWVRTIRHCQTVRDNDDNYPTQADVDRGMPVVYPFRFTRIEFEESPGWVTPDISFLCPESEFDGYFLNYYCNEFDAYLAEGTDVWIYNVTGQWFTYAVSSECESESSSSLSSSLSSGGSSLSSESSLSSSLSSGGSSLSSESSLSSSLSSGGSSLSSESSLSSLSSGGSSLSSSISSGGSSLSDFSSGGSSLSSCPPCEGEEVEVMTGITTEFDSDTCELTITPETIRICFPTGSGIVICG